MRRRSFLKGTLAGSAGVMVTQLAQPPKAKAQLPKRRAEMPNILWICTDQQRYDTIHALGNEYILEVNTLPGLTPRSLLPRLARHAGIEYAELIEQILASARVRGPSAGQEPVSDASETPKQRPNLVSC